MIREDGLIVGCVELWYLLVGIVVWFGCCCGLECVFGYVVFYEFGVGYCIGKD